MSRSRPPTSPPASGGPKEALAALLGADAGDPGAHSLRRALWLDTLDQQLRPCLPPALAAHARLANIDRGRLVYLVDAPVWHARMRLAATALLDAARSLGLDANDVVVRTASWPAGLRPPRPDTSTTSAPSLSAAAREAFATALAARDAPSREDPSRVCPEAPPHGEGGPNGHEAGILPSGGVRRVKK